MAFLYPWGNTQQLNLDWILQKIKELEAGSESGGVLEEVANALISAAYSPSQAYSRSDIVYYAGKLYRANQAIPAPGEEWTPAHWDEILLGDTVSNLVRYVAALSNNQIANSSNVSGTHTSDALNSLNNAINANSPFSGTKVSVIGDSMSTYKGYIYTDYSGVTVRTTYPAGDVQSVDSTWWKMFINAIGGTLEVNASYTGARATVNGSYPTLYGRVSVIGNPDIIFVALCYNDYQHSVTLGEYDFTTAYASLSEQEFRPAIIKGLKALQATKPNATVVYVIITPDALSTADERVFNTYKDSIIHICSQLGITYIVATKDSTIDNIHPNAHGMKQIESSILNPWLPTYGGSIFGDVVSQSHYQDLLHPLPSSSSESQRVGNTFEFQDMNGYRIALFRAIQLRGLDGSTGIDIVGQNLVNGSVVNNYVRLLVDTNGNRVISLNAQDAWLSALGLTVEDFSASVTIPDNTLAAYSFEKYGKHIDISFQGASKTYAANDTLFTLPSGYRPSSDNFAFCGINAKTYCVIKLFASTGICQIVTINDASQSGRIYGTLSFNLT